VFLIYLMSSLNGKKEGTAVSNTLCDSTVRGCLITLPFLRLLQYILGVDTRRLKSFFTFLSSVVIANVVATNAADYKPYK